MKKKIKKIVIIGGGIGGLKLSTNLGLKFKKNEKISITLIDKNPNYIWKPLLHEVASGSIDENINSLNYLYHSKNNYFKFEIGEMIDIDRINKNVILGEIIDKNGILISKKRIIFYDILIISIGSTSNDFNIQGVKENCKFLDDIKQAKNINKNIINLFNKFYFKKKKKKKIKISIIGGGATGVELSSEILNTFNEFQKYKSNNFDKNLLQIKLLEASKNILPSLNKKISYFTTKELIKIGINILTNTMVTKVDSFGLYTKNNKYIKSDIMIWTAGIKAPDFIKKISCLETNNINQIIVKSTLQTTIDSNIFAIGDCSYCLCKDGIISPPRAQAANQMAYILYKNIISILKNKPLKKYTYKDSGTFISLSKFNSFGILINNFIKKKFFIKGKIARLLYLIIYRTYQISLYGCVKTVLIIIIDYINKKLRPNVKLY
ncbi:MAG: NAD(P)/FAD-dependent oxidoreductase [Candidatus Makana argininalis]